jgi:nucleoside-diphosphate-sugar epimerase
MTKILVTGGSGFLGRAIVRELTEPGPVISASCLRVFDLNEYRGPGKERIEFVKGDVRNFASLREACKGMELVIHSAAIVDWGTRSEDEILSVNVKGTENVLKACREHGIPNLVYTSSLDAIFGGKPLVDIDETIPYPENHPNSYCRSKFLAEKLVLAANGASLKTVVLRPADIYGEEDPYHIGSLLAMAKGGFYVRLGDGTAKSQHVYSGNMAHAHLLAAKALLDGNSRVAGNAYLITDSPGVNFFRFFDRIVEGADYRIRPKNLWLPRKFAMTLGYISEMTAILLRPFIRYTPKMSRFAVIYTCTDFTFTSEKAKADFGFLPKYTPEEAFERTVRSCKAKKNQP